MEIFGFVVLVVVSLIVLVVGLILFRVMALLGTVGPGDWLFVLIVIGLGLAGLYLCYTHAPFTITRIH